jgi:predicted PurR-regulated permease PerM
LVKKIINYLKIPPQKKPFVKIANFMQTNFPLSARFAFGLISLIGIVFIMSVLKGILIPLAFGGILAMLLHPICHRLEGWKLPRVVAIFICLILVVGFIFGLFTLVVNQLSTFSEELPAYSSKVTQLLNKLQIFIEQKLNIRKGKQGAELQKYGLEALKNSGEYISNFLSGTSNLLANASLVPIYVFFFLYYRDFLKVFLHRLLKNTKTSKINLVISKIYEVVQSYLLGLFLVIFIVAVLNSVGLMFLDIDYAIFLGTFAAFLLLIPYIGITIGALLPIIIALLTKDSPLYAVAVLGLFLAVQALESNLITPYVVGSKVSINSFAAIIALLLGGQLWGMAGLVLALPIIAIIKVIFDNVPGLQPYGYLLGEAEMKKKKSYL